MPEKGERKSAIFFEVGGRYRNRFGWYEVIEIFDKEMLVRYETNGKKQILDFESQRRIISNIEAEEKAVIPYEDHDRNAAYFRTLGYIAKNSFIEAIVPLKSKSGFDNSYYRIKGHYPSDQQGGYYTHRDEEVDKWGIEMRLTFKVPNNLSLDDLDFGPGVNIVRSPNDNERRINSNTLCWRLLKIGFELGGEHDLRRIEDNIPHRYREDYRKGISIT